jgi:hypothetical protein
MKLNKRAIEVTSSFRPFFSFGKKGMEMWQLVLMILVLILLIVVIVWYGILGWEIKELLGKFGELF